MIFFRFVTFVYFCTLIKILRITRGNYGTIERDDIRAESAADSEFYFSIVTGQPAPADVFAGGCGYCRKVLGYQCAGFCWCQYVGRLFDFRILQRVLRRFRHSGGTEVRSPRLCDDAALCIGQPEASGGDVGRGGHCHQSALRIYPAFHAHTGEYL